MLFLSLFISDLFIPSAFQPTLALDIALSVMTRLYVNTFPNQYLQTLVDWLVGTTEEMHCIVGSAPEDHGKEQVSPGRGNYFVPGGCQLSSRVHT